MAVRSKKRAWEVGSAVALLMVVLVCGTLGAWWLDRPRQLNEQLSKSLDEIKAGTLDGGRDVTLKDSRRLRELVRQGARPDVASDGGLTVLAAAASAGDLEFVNELAASGMRMDGGGTGLPALTVAARAGNEEVVEFLLRNGAPVSGDVMGMTPLMFATLSGNTRIIRMLVKAGADVNAKDVVQRTPLMWSTDYGHPEAVRTLLSLGADIKLMDSQGRTALDSALKTRARLKRRLTTEKLKPWDTTVALLQRASKSK